MSVNERRHPDIQETALDFLSDYEQRKFEKFKSLLGADMTELTDYTLYRFLKINTFYTTPALKQLKDYLQWRKDQQIDAVLQTLPPHQDVLRALIPHGYHGYDLDGRPIYVEKTGKTAVAALTDEAVLPRADHMRCHVWGVERLMRLCFERSLATHRRIETFTSIIDMEGLSLSHRSALPVLNACMTLDSQYYPEFIGKLFIINTPFLAPLVYQAVSPFVPKEVRERMHVVGDIHQLTQHIAIDQLPIELEGSCRLHGDHQCIPDTDPADIASLIQHAHAEPSDNSEGQPEGDQIEGDGDVVMGSSTTVTRAPAAQPAKSGWKSWLRVA